MKPIPPIPLQETIETGLADAISAFCGGPQPQHGPWIRHVSPIICDIVRRKRATGSSPENLVDLLRDQADSKAFKIGLRSVSSAYRSPGDIAVTAMMVASAFVCSPSSSTKDFR